MANSAKPSRRAWRLLGRALGAFALLFAITLAYFHSSNGQERLRAAVERSLAEKVNGRVRVDHFAFRLLGALAIGGVHIADESGREAIALDELRIAPAWLDLLRGRIAVDRIDVRGVRVHASKDAAGGTSLDALFKKPPAPEQAPAPAEPSNRRIELRKLDVTGVAIAIDQPDGSCVRVDDLELDACASAVPGEKTVALEIGHVGLTLTIDKGEGGLKVGVRNLATGLTASLDRGAGQVTLHPTTGTIVLARPAQPEATIPLSLGALAFDIRADELRGSLKALAAGALALEAIDVAGARDDAGDRRADVLGLRVDAHKINELLGREVVASDADLELHVTGKGQDATIAASARTNGGTLRVDGSLATDPHTPAYDVTVSGDAIATSKLLLPGASAVPPIDVGHLALHVKGQGTTAAAATADVNLRVEKVRARGIPIDRVAVDAHVDRGTVTIDSATVEGLSQRAAMSGKLDLESKAVDVSLGVEGDPGAALAALRAAGMNVKGALPKGALVLKKGDLNVHARGHLDGAMTVDVNAPHVDVVGGRVAIDAHALLDRDASAPDSKPELRDVDATVTMTKLPLGAIAELGGKHLPIDAMVSGRAQVKGAPRTMSTHLSVDVTDVRAGIVPIDVAFKLDGQTTPRNAHVDFTAKRVGADGATWMAARADIPLAGKRLDREGPLALRVDVPNRSFADLLDAVALPAVVKHQLPSGQLAAAIDVHGTPARPDGNVDVDVRARLFGDKEQRVRITGTVVPDTALHGNLDVSAWLDDTQPETLVAKLGAAQIGGNDLAWTADVDLRPQRLDALTLPPEIAAKLRAIGGEARAHAALRGSLSDVLGDVRVEARDVKVQGRGPVAAALAVALDDRTTSIDAGVDVAGSPLLTARGTAALGGKGLLAKIREHAAIDPALDVAVDVPKRTLASLAPLWPGAASLPGGLEGHVAVFGTTHTPLAKGRIAAAGFDTIDGRVGGVALDVDANERTLATAIAIGPLDDRARPVRIAAAIDRERLARAGGGEPLPIEASLRAERVDLRSLAPKAALGDRADGLRGTLDADLALHALVAEQGGKRELVEGALVGKLDVANGVIPLPKSSRSYRDVTVHLESDTDGIRSLLVSAMEGDPENRHRTIELRGNVDLDKLHPRHADLRVLASKWLLFGTSAMGRPDAPRGTLSLDARVSADVDSPVKHVSADVKKLEVLFPDRFEKAHQPEDAHVGDVMFVGDPGVVVGKLPVPKARTVEAAPEPPPADADEDEERGLDADVTIEDAHVLQSPLDLTLHGALAIQSRPSGRTIRGKLEMKKGVLALGGKTHPLRKGSILFDDAHREGYLDLLFARRVPVPGMAEISEASAGEDVTIHMFGPLADRKTVLAGAGSPGALWDLLAMHNAGHVRYASEPGMPASYTVAFPDLDRVLVLSFLSVNLPHLTVLDRASAWANPYDDRKSYGRLEHYEAERTTDDGHVRVRATQQPPKLGVSQSQLELDWMLKNTARSRVGVGVTGGSRGGGGPTAFWEWSSKD